MALTSVEGLPLQVHHSKSSPASNKISADHDNESKESTITDDETCSSNQKEENEKLVQLQGDIILHKLPCSLVLLPVQAKPPLAQRQR